jgi:hypothetical protein
VGAPNKKASILKVMILCFTTGGGMLPPKVDIRYIEDDTLPKRRYQPTKRHFPPHLRDSPTNLHGVTTKNNDSQTITARNTSELIISANIY